MGSSEKSPNRICSWEGYNLNVLVLAGSAEGPYLKLLIMQRVTLATLREDLSRITSECLALLGQACMSEAGHFVRQ